MVDVGDERGDVEAAGSGDFIYSLPPPPLFPLFPGFLLPIVPFPPEGALFVNGQWSTVNGQQASFHKSSMGLDRSR